MSRTSEPACRVCGCTQNNACIGNCSWVRREPGSPPLCSACSGTEGDMAETVRRGVGLLSAPDGLSRLSVKQAIAMGRAALRRRNALRRRSL